MTLFFTEQQQAFSQCFIVLQVAVGSFQMLFFVHWAFVYKLPSAERFVLKGTTDLKRQLIVLWTDQLILTKQQKISEVLHFK